ncbi:MAG: molecular chaperone DnaJ [Candidatus Pacebacteria bacterium]|nr:molecular chaperone DnaJ [Candidatus Paceibacterota bacterium]
MSKDHYNTLGISKDASDDEIKKAFRKLAHKYHPDKGGGDEAKFKEINEAYQILSDKQKRAQYDQFGSAFEGAGGGASAGFGGFDFSGFSGGGPGGVKFEFGGDGGGFGDIFGDIFGGGGGEGRRQQQERGNDVSVDVEISLEEAVTDTERDVNLHLSSVCSKCDGSGAELGSNIKSCRTCSGTGQVKKEKRTILGVFAQMEICQDCQGQGEKPEKNCSKCGGDGRTKESRNIKIKIPAGIATGQTIRLSGQGEVGFRPKSGKSVPGDLYLTVHIKPHQIFKRNGDDIIYNLEINFSQAVFGDKIEVQTLQGKIKLKIPAGIQSGKIIKLKDKGLPHLQGRGKGNMFVVIIIKTPEKLSKKQKRLFEELKKEGL